MSEHRTHVVVDLAKHLTDDLRRTIDRHAYLAQGGGASTVEWSAALMMTVESIVLQGLAAVVIGTPADRRSALFDVAMDKLRLQIDNRRGQVMLAGDLADALLRR